LKTKIFNAALTFCSAGVVAVKSKVAGANPTIFGFTYSYNASVEVGLGVLISERKYFLF
jgi:hypothetical protein